MPHVAKLLFLQLVTLMLTNINASAHPMGCLPAMVRNALAQANSACGITVISTLRVGARIAGSSHVSKHASCHAADFTSRDYSCVRRVLAGYPGAMSVDVATAGHIHIDDGPFLRFAHSGARTRHARGGPAGRQYARRYAGSSIRVEERTP